MYSKMLIVKLTHKTNFPLNVRSTAVQINDKLIEFFDKDKYCGSLDPYEKEFFVAKACIFLACKFEDIHGFLNKIMEQIDERSNFKHFDKILEKEIEIIERLGFDFDFVNIFQSAFCIYSLLKQNNMISMEWEQVCNMINVSLVVTDLNHDLSHCVFSVFSPKSLEKLGVPFDLEKTVEIMSKIKKFTPLNEKQMKDILKAKN